MTTSQKSKISQYYDWAKTLSFNADVSLVIASRGRGKTFGIRLTAVKDHIKNGYTFVEICRYKNEVSPVMDGYFDKLAPLFPDYIFRTCNGKGEIAPKPKREKDKPNWRTICYFIALSDAQNAKKRTYKDVKRLIFDEGVLDRTDRYHRYVPHEYSKLANIVDTCTRERSDSSIHPHLYILGNACDLMNPYFQQYGIDKIPEYGYSWYRDKTVIVHYEDPAEYADAKLEGTVSGRMTKGTAEGEIAARNTFQVSDSSLIAKKPKHAEYVCGFFCDGKRFGVWTDDLEGYWYITEKLIESDAYVTYFITRADATINRFQAYRATPAIVALVEAHRLSCIKYETYSIMNNFLDMLSRFGA